MSTTSLDARSTSREAARSLYDRVLAAIPVIVVAISVLILYAVEAWLRKTPSVFTDEVEWTQISRSIAATGHAARRGQPIYFKSLYAYLIAPAWWIHSTATAYAFIKYLNVIVMASAAIPTYLLARMLVTKRSAFIVAVLAVLIPGMSYGSSIVIEILAYPWYALCSWLIVRALISHRRLDLGLAIAASIVAGLVRWPQFATVAIAFAIAAGILWFIGPRGRAMRAGWSRADYVGAIALFYGALILFNRVILQHEPIWQISTQYWKGRMLSLGLQAAQSFTVGLGILPVIGGFAALRVKERSADPRYRAFAAYLGASIFCVGLYTAVKAAYLSTVFSTLTEERNLIYLSPLLLLGTAIVFESRRVSKWVVAGATAFVLILTFREPFQLLFPYYEAPGEAILTIPTRNWGWTVQDLRLVLLGVLLLGLLMLRYRRVAPVAVAAVVLGGAWMLTSEIDQTHGIVNFSNRLRSDLPTKLDWVDADVHGQPVTYLGQEVTNANIELATEFWNRSIKHVDTLDGSLDGPGPSPVPNVISTDGQLDMLGDAPYVLADEGVYLQAKVVDSWANMRLYKRTGPWKLLDAEQQVYADTWAPAWSTYTYFKPGQHGVLQLSIGRDGYNGPTDAAHPNGHATITVGSVKVSGGVFSIAHVYEVKHVLVRNGQAQVVNFPVPKTPVRIVIQFPVTQTIHVGTDPRDLGAQVGFKFIRS